MPAGAAFTGAALPVALLLSEGAAAETNMSGETDTRSNNEMKLTRSATVTRTAALAAYLGVIWTLEVARVGAGSVTR